MTFPSTISHSILLLADGDLLARLELGMIVDVGSSAATAET